MKKLFKLGLIFLIFIITVSLFSCVDTSKKVTVSNNTEEEILVEENISKELINNGKRLLLDKKYDEAMANYNKAIELDKGNKDLYLEIKDSFLEANRFDDAYFIAKEAIANNIDVDNMTQIAKNISEKLEIIKINDKVEQDSEYYIPKNVNATINGKSISLLIKWDYSKADTSYINLRGTMDVGDLNISTDKPITQRETLCWIELKNNIAYSIYRQYTP